MAEPSRLRRRKANQPPQPPSLATAEGSGTPPPPSPEPERPHPETGPREAELSTRAARGASGRVTGGGGRGPRLPRNPAPPAPDAPKPETAASLAQTIARLPPEQRQAFEAVGRIVNRVLGGSRAVNAAIRSPFASTPRARARDLLTTIRRGSAQNLAAAARDAARAAEAGGEERRRKAEADRAARLATLRQRIADARAGRGTMPTAREIAQANRDSAPSGQQRVEQPLPGQERLRGTRFRTEPFSVDRFRERVRDEAVRARMEEAARIQKELESRAQTLRAALQANPSDPALLRRYLRAARLRDSHARLAREAERSGAYVTPDEVRAFLTPSGRAAANPLTQSAFEAIHPPLTPAEHIVEGVKTGLRFWLASRGKRSYPTPPDVENARRGLLNPPASEFPEPFPDEGGDAPAPRFSPPSTPPPRAGGGGGAGRIGGGRRASPAFDGEPDEAEAKIHGKRGTKERYEEEHVGRRSTHERLDISGAVPGRIRYHHGDPESRQAIFSALGGTQTLPYDDLPDQPLGHEEIAALRRYDVQLAPQSPLERLRAQRQGLPWGLKPVLTRRPVGRELSDEKNPYIHGGVLRLLQTHRIALRPKTRWEKLRDRIEEARHNLPRGYFGQFEPEIVPLPRDRWRKVAYDNRTEAAENPAEPVKLSTQVREAVRHSRLSFHGVDARDAARGRLVAGRVPHWWRFFAREGLRERR